MSYNYNLCIALPSGVGQSAQLIRDHAPRQVAKHPHNSDWFIIELNDERPKPSDLAKVQKLNRAARSRLYVFGHGSRTAPKVGGRTPEQVADLLVNRYRLSKVEKLSLIACWGGGDAHNLNNSVNQSFAQKLHWLLGKTYRIKTEITARTERMTTRPDGTHRVRSPLPGGPAVKGPMTHKGMELKWLFGWDGERQKISKAYDTDLTGLKGLFGD